MQYTEWTLQCGEDIKRIQGIIDVLKQQKAQKIPPWERKDLEDKLQRYNCILHDLIASKRQLERRKERYENN